jgi:hypothetical protein
MLPYEALLWACFVCQQVFCALSRIPTCTDEPMLASFYCMELRLHSHEHQGSKNDFILLFKIKNREDIFCKRRLEMRILIQNKFS